MDETMQAHAEARARWAAQVRHCAICMTEIEDALETTQLARLPAAEQAVAYFTLALLDAGLAGHERACTLLVEWLVTERLTARQAAWEAVVRLGPRLKTQAYTVIGAGSSPADGLLRCVALQVLANHQPELEALALAYAPADVLYRLHEELTTDYCALPAPLGAT